MPPDRDRPRGEPSALTDKLARLFAVLRPPEEPYRPWRNNEVVAACRAAGREMSESHLSQLRRGIKQNPTSKVLATLAWFFEVPVGYFTDPAVAAEVEMDLAAREAALRTEQDAEQEVTAAQQELEDTLRRLGVSKMAHRGVGAATNRERAAMMRRLNAALAEEEAQHEADQSRAGKPDGGAAPPSGRLS